MPIWKENLSNICAFGICEADCEAFCGATRKLDTLEQVSIIYRKSLKNIVFAKETKIMT